ncbi:hypothetical protein TeGR_g13091 [Tetraparma gracilis]|uniref:AB hydrolase-1 domain-containing protein n=1 Tax=Tetraparma gracilis TaxID=2962635 RepID=A0ABQ6N2C1_9STRA|nr:hypothetical protein TeGR_g13091 [Tetraparma gracilis]
MLLLSGWTGVGDDWSGFAKLCSGRDVVTYDPRGLGFSELLPSSSPPPAQSIPLLASDALQVLRAAGVSSPPSVFGTSLGGMIGLTLASLTPLHSLHLACSTFGPHPTKQLPKPASAFFGTFSAFANDNSQKDRAIMSAFSSSLLAPMSTTAFGRKTAASLSERFVSSRLLHGPNGTGAAINAQLAALRKFDGWQLSESLLSSTSPPRGISVIVGCGDAVIPPEHSRAMHEHLKSLAGSATEIQLLETAAGSGGVQHGHFAHVTAGREVTAFVDDFDRGLRLAPVVR